MSVGDERSAQPRMRISIPTIPTHSTSTPTPPAEAIQRVVEFLAPGTVALITGAGVSVDSGIRAYRGHDGRYMNPNYQPILYHELVDETERGFTFRQRYWLRSYLGYQPVVSALPNTTHYALAALQHASVVPRIITQNVDGLHHKALSLSHLINPQEAILELHGTLHRVRCKHGHPVDRSTFQQMLSLANPQWKAFLDDVERTGNKPRTNPDGDVDAESLGASYTSFTLPDCPTCLLQNRRNSTHKPEVVFFGESISQEVKDRSFLDVERSDRLMIIGTTLATYSAFRLLKHAVELRKPVLVVNVGPTRADGVPGVEKVDVASGVVMPDVVRALLGSRVQDDKVILEMLQSGVVNPPPADDDDRTEG
ncbi:DHS-like NAD/FAD-binding domain-containing protein [Guyanagaster necrorhizus]|uniref:DHS-like NAD/FAD-binding domain-containing protein n=1 Tax=Guyanagaster necrorhizus TaxID=856835 RepID=A0A9P8ARL5_9AGAR|nr:DHS-like NAD/FAD-binding domain-containing protein [Guyanagaster necrorhizus MCA 3950]KAG7445026.1 DHS-like NAD/FAD-binding domain-containing protein [Guyanagaster necrorhizus MCA 3950]